MLHGIDKFKEHFNGFSDDYVVIGGLATVMVLSDLGFIARATKDIDLVVVSKENEEFIRTLLKFIDFGGYTTKQRTDNKDRHNMFRFVNPTRSEFPEQIELFAVHSEQSQIITDTSIGPIETPSYYMYLSAILLNEEYFNLLIRYTMVIDGLRIATPEVLIPLKMHAHLNLKHGEHNYDDKHLKDVIRLSVYLDGESRVEITGRPKEDFDNFLPLIEEINEQRVKDILRSIGEKNITKASVISLLTATFQSV